MLVFKKPRPETSGFLFCLLHTVWLHLLLSYCFVSLGSLPGPPLFKNGPLRGPLLVICVLAHVPGDTVVLVNIAGGGREVIDSLSLHSSATEVQSLLTVRTRVMCDVGNLKYPSSHKIDLL